MRLTKQRRGEREGEGERDREILAEALREGWRGEISSRS